VHLDTGNSGADNFTIVNTIQQFDTGNNSPVARR